MDAEKIGTVRGRSGKVYEVWWDSSSTDLYVRYVGTLIAQAEGSHAPVGQASSAGEAMRTAEALYSDK